MIAMINGIVRDIESDGIVVETHGVGFFIHVPASLLEIANIGQPIQLYTQLIVREDAFHLVGFDKKESRDLFNLLLGVNGVGLRLALSILSTLDPDIVRQAIAQNQVDLLSRVPGVGRKTAQKIIVSLQDKMGEISYKDKFAKLGESDLAVIEALTALGYSVIEAQNALQAIPPKIPEDDIEARLRAALNYFNPP
ncbi:MAG: Holliday junction branch migration protein RuvA [Anaerolineales bacterium]